MGYFISRIFVYVELDKKYLLVWILELAWIVFNYLL